MLHAKCVSSMCGLNREQVIDSMALLLWGPSLILACIFSFFFFFFTSFCDACKLDLEDTVSPEKKNKSKARTGYKDTGYRTRFRLLQGSFGA